uniref:Uncharacterized protein n=1 Tax=Rousettus aegyptiacus TaxID=9407 RepID=A0A7J8IN76_ROUAE|nr:hypothetical protein HJG63_010739 [Rousettus aegyptiacus]
MGGFRQRNAGVTPVWLQTEAWVGDAATKREDWAEGCCATQGRNREVRTNAALASLSPSHLSQLPFPLLLCSHILQKNGQWAVGPSDVEGVCMALRQDICKSGVYYWRQLQCVLSPANILSPSRVNAAS